MTPDLSDGLTLQLQAPDPMGGKPWQLYCAEFYVPNRTMAQSAYFYAQSFADAQARLLALSGTDVKLYAVGGVEPA